MSIVKTLIKSPGLRIDALQAKILQTFKKYLN